MLPPNAACYKRTAEFTDASVPSGLLRSHATKAGSWGKIVVVEGSLVYRILEPEITEVLLSPGVPGIIEPERKHEVVPHPGVRFYVEFHRVQDG